MIIVTNQNAEAVLENPTATPTECAQAAFTIYRRTMKYEAAVKASLAVSAARRAGGL